MCTCVRVCVRCVLWQKGSGARRHTDFILGLSFTSFPGYAAASACVCVCMCLSTCLCAVNSIIYTECVYQVIALLSRQADEVEIP